MNELTREQTQQQDRVDNAIYALLNELASHVLPEGSHLTWNIEDIAVIREVAWASIVDNAKNHPDMELDEQKFYPFLEEDEDDFGRDWCDFCQASCVADADGNCPACHRDVIAWDME